ncbi:MAG TPA: hypothetical protein VE197_19765, partial [Mycobacterium sp.]|nr:hypothetical protein [Mycobacterium sp.]
GGGAGSLFLNYRVSRQTPAPGQRLALGRRTRSADDRPAGFKRTPLTVWGSQSPPCAPPPGYMLVASSTTAVITSHAYTQYSGTPYVGWYGCLKALGAQRLLTSGIDMDGYGEKRLGQAVAAGAFAAFSFGYVSGKYPVCTNSVEIYDLKTGKPGQVFVKDCSYPGLYVPGAIDSLSVNSQGFAVWRLTIRGSTGAESAQLYAYDTHGVRLLDESALDASASLTDIKLTGNLLTWTNGGVLHRATLL